MRLSPLLLSLSMCSFSGAWAAPSTPLTPLAASQAMRRPTVQSLLLTLDDGSILTLSASELGGADGGFIVWNSFGVTQIAMAYLWGRGDNPHSPDAIWNLWSPPADADGPVAFLVVGGNLTPLGAAHPGVRTQRAKLVSVGITLSNGTTRSMPFKMLEDPINGVLVWGDPMVQATLVPFYNARPGLRSNSNTVQNRWNTPDASGVLPVIGLGFAFGGSWNILEAGGVLPAAMTKPQCEPSGWP